jgi:hypothetical protein
MPEIHNKKIHSFSSEDPVSHARETQENLVEVLIFPVFSELSR